MLSILIHWLYVGGLSFLFGHVILWLFKTVTGGKSSYSNDLHISLHILTGLAGLSALAYLTHFVIPLNFNSTIPLLILLLCYCFLKKSALKETLNNYLFYLNDLRKLTRVQQFTILIIFLSSLTLLLTSSCIPTNYYDDGLYYQQYILWLDSFPVIPGLGNIHPRLAYNSSWHLLCSFFNFSGVLSPPINNLNSFLHLIILVYSLGGIVNLFNGKLSFSNYLKASLLIPTHLFAGLLTAPSPDLPVIYTIWIVVILWFENTKHSISNRKDLSLFLILLLSVFAITTKLSAIPIVFLLILIAFSSRKYLSRKKLTLFIAFALVFSTPWLITNWILSGYLIFPIHQVDFFNPSWKVPVEIAEEETLYIRAFAWGKQLATSIPYYTVHELDILEKIRAWYQDLRLSSTILLIINFLMTIGCIVALISMLIRAIIKNTFQQNNFLPLQLFYLSGIAFWFFIAPDFRFGYAFTAGVYIVLIGWLFYRMSRIKKYAQTTVFIFCLLIILVYSKPVVSSISQYACMVHETNKTYLLVLETYLDMPGETISQNELKINLPLCNDQCWDSPLPCSPYPDIGFILRRENIGVQGGFINPQPDIKLYRKWLEYYQPLGKNEQLYPDCVFPCN